jgi:hypothetical protein
MFFPTYQKVNANVQKHLNHKVLCLMFRGLYYYSMKFLGEQGSALSPTTPQEFTAGNSSIGTRTYVLMAIAKKNLQ